MSDTQTGAAILEHLPAAAGRPGITYRQAGDRFLLVEYGDMTLDLRMNFRIFGLNEALRRAAIPGVVETVPAACSPEVPRELVPSSEHP